MSRGKARLVAVAAIAALLIVTVIVVVRARNQEPTVRLAVGTASASTTDAGKLPSSRPWPVSGWIISPWKLDEANHFHLELIERLAGKGALESVLDGHADIAVVGSAPLVAAALTGKDLLVLAHTESSTRQLRLVTTPDHVTDWYEHPISYLRGTVFESALDSMVITSGHGDLLRSGKLDLVPLAAPEAEVNNLVDGTVGSSVMLLAQATMLTQTQTGDAKPSRFVDITAKDVYQFNSFVVTTKARWSANREGILRAMQAYRQSRTLIHDDPDRRLLDIHRQEAGESSLSDVRPYFWSEDELIFDTNASRITTALKAEADIMLEAGRVPHVPDFAPLLGELPAVAARTGS